MTDSESESSEEFVGDLQDEDGHMIVLPEPARHNIPAHEKEPTLFMDHKLNLVSFLSILVHFCLFLSFTEISSLLINEEQQKLKHEDAL